MHAALTSRLSHGINLDEKRASCTFFNLVVGVNDYYRQEVLVFLLFFNYLLIPILFSSIEALSWARLKCTNGNAPSD